MLGRYKTFRRLTVVPHFSPPATTSRRNASTLSTPCQRGDRKMAGPGDAPSPGRSQDVGEPVYAFTRWCGGERWGEILKIGRLWSPRGRAPGLASRTTAPLVVLARPELSRVLCPLRGGDHLSTTPVTRRLQRPTRGLGEQLQRPLSGLAPSGVYLAGRSPARRWALTSTISPSPRPGPRLCIFCGTFPGLSPAGCYPALCSVELGLSSTARAAAVTSPVCQRP